jgi:hypothetical protein
MDYYVYVLRRGSRLAARDARAEPAMPVVVASAATWKTSTNVGTI